MVDVKELVKFAKLPLEFTRNITPLIENAIDEYDECRAYVRHSLDFYAVDAFKNPDAYREVAYDVQNVDLPDSFEVKLLAVIDLMKKENCYEETY